MPGRTARSLFSLTLLAFTVAACAPKSPEESASDTDDTTTDQADTVATTGATETGETDTGATDTGETAGDACEAPDPAAKASVSISFGDWPIVADSYPEQKHVDAACTVQSATSVGGVIDIALLCTEGELVDMPIGLRVEGPADFAVDLVADDAVALAAYWQADGHHIFTGHWFTLHGAGGELLLAGLDYDAGAAPSDDLAPLKVTPVGDLCEPDCEGGCDPLSDGVERVGLAFSHPDASVEILDGARAQLIAGGRRYDIVVAEAEYWYCLNCGSQYTWILRQADQE